MQKLLLIPFLIITTLLNAGSIVFDGKGSPADVGFTVKTSASDIFEFDTPFGMLQNENVTAGGTVSLNSEQFFEIADRTTGWIAKAHLEILSNTGDEFGNVFAVADEIGGIAVIMTPSLLKVFDREFTTQIGTIAIGEGFHTIAIEMLPNAKTANIYVDQTIGDIPSLVVPEEKINGPALHGILFGDTSSGSASQSNLQTLSLSAIPVIPAVPELSSLVFLGFGLIGFVFSRKKFC